MTNFVDDNTSLAYPKADLVAAKAGLEDQTLAAGDWNEICQAVIDLRGRVVICVNVRSFGAVGDGVADDTAAIIAASRSARGKNLYFPRGKYKTSSVIILTSRYNRWIGDLCSRGVGTAPTDNGSEIIFTGGGPCVQIGVDLGIDWDANGYGGPQDQVFENLWFSHGAPDTQLVSVGAAGSHYKAGAYGIWDWYGGGVVMRNVGLEKFEANFVGIQSDFCNFLNVTSLYSKYGLYLGPRSDQAVIRDLYSFYCDRAITIDKATCARIEDANIVDCGTATASPIEVRRGSSAVRIERPWFEHLHGYAGTDQISFVSAGEVDGYGPGGSVSAPGGAPTVTPVSGCSVLRPLVYTPAAGVASHTKYLATVGKCQRFELQAPAVPQGSSLANLDTLVYVPAAQAPTGTETQIDIAGVSSDLALAKMFVNGAAPAYGANAASANIRASGASGIKDYGGGRFSIHTLAATAGADEIRISQENQPGNVYIQTPQYTGGQTVRLRLLKAINTGVAAAAPTTGTWEVGDKVLVANPAPGGHTEWVCVVGGTPGTWQKAGFIGYSGTGTPEGAVTAPIGSLYTRTDGGAGTTLYVKESGAGNTGWVGK